MIYDFKSYLLKNLFDLKPKSEFYYFWPSY